MCVLHLHAITAKQRLGTEKINNYTHSYLRNKRLLWYLLIVDYSKWGKQCKTTRAYLEAFKKALPELNTLLFTTRENHAL